MKSFDDFIWNYFRLENEHLNNCGQFRAVRDISIRPTPSVIADSLLEQSVRQEIDNQHGQQANRSEDEMASTRTSMEVVNTFFKWTPNLRLSRDN